MMYGLTIPEFSIIFGWVAIQLWLIWRAMKTEPTPGVIAG